MTRKVTFRCTRYTHLFVVDVVEPEEAELKDIRVVPVKCPKCMSQAFVRE